MTGGKLKIDIRRKRILEQLRLEGKVSVTELSKVLDVTPVPDTVLRVFVVWRGLDAPVEIEAQTLTAPTREGFTLVEWGGTELK